MADSVGGEISKQWKNVSVAFLLPRKVMSDFVEMQGFFKWEIKKSNSKNLLPGKIERVIHNWHLVSVKKKKKGWLLLPFKIILFTQ